MTGAELDEAAEAIHWAVADRDTRKVIQAAYPVIERQVRKRLLARLGEALVDRLSDRKLITEIYDATEGTELSDRGPLVNFEKSTELVTRDVKEIK